MQCNGWTRGQEKVGMRDDDVGVGGVRGTGGGGGGR